MNFPDVPIDEKLFESNEMMREYWDRSTQNRGVHFVPDVRAEEDFEELRSLTAEAYDSIEEIVEAPMRAETMDAVVTPKATSVSDSTVFWVLIGLIAAFVAYAIYKRQDTKRY